MLVWPTLAPTRITRAHSYRLNESAPHGRPDAREKPQFLARKRRVAGLPRGSVRPARPVGSQKHSLFLSGSACPHSPERQSRWATGPAVRRTALLALGPKLGKKVQPNSPPNSQPRVSLTAAPLALRRSFARLGKSCQNAQAHFDDFPPKAGRAMV